VRHRKAETLPKGLGIMSYRIAGKRRTGGPELRRVQECTPMLLWVLAMPSDRCISAFPHVYADAAYHLLPIEILTVPVIPGRRSVAERNPKTA
jgi:hypothetical protein